MKLISDRLVSIGEAMVELAPEGDDRYRQGFAGDCFNTVWHMGHLLADKARCGFVTTLGTDRFSERFVREMQADGLDTSGIMRDETRTMGLYLIELDGAERSFHYWRKDSAARRLADDPTALERALADAALVHVSGITLAILDAPGRDRLFSALRSLRQKGAIVTFDPNVRPKLWASAEECRETLLRMLGLTDIALPSFDDEAALWGDAEPEATLQRMAALGIAEAVVKDGSKPVHVLSEGTISSFETPPVHALRDTTGAGDSFNAGYLAGRCLGRDMAGAVALGQRLSGIVIGHLGARADKPALHALRQAEKIA